MASAAVRRRNQPQPDQPSWKRKTACPQPRHLQCPLHPCVVPGRKLQPRRAVTRRGDTKGGSALPSPRPIRTGRDVETASGRRGLHRGAGEPGCLRGPGGSAATIVASPLQPRACSVRLPFVRLLLVGCCTLGTCCGIYFTLRSSSSSSKSSHTNPMSSTDRSPTHTCHRGYASRRCSPLILAV